MYCHVVKWPVFSLQRGSAKWPIAPSNFSSLWIGRLLGQSSQKKKHINYWGQQKIKKCRALALYTDSINKHFVCDSFVYLFSLHVFIKLIYSHLFDNCRAHAYQFEKFHPPQKKSTLQVYWFLRSFPPSTPHLLELCISFFLKIPPSTFIPTSTFSNLAYFAPPPRLFQPPRLLERWEYAFFAYTCIQDTRVKYQ